MGHIFQSFTFIRDKLEMAWEMLFVPPSLQSLQQNSQVRGRKHGEESQSVCNIKIL